MSKEKKEEVKVLLNKSVYQLEIEAKNAPSYWLSVIVGKEENFEEKEELVITVKPAGGTHDKFKFEKSKPEVIEAVGKMLIAASKLRPKDF